MVDFACTMSLIQAWNQCAMTQVDIILQYEYTVRIVYPLGSEVFLLVATFWTKNKLLKMLQMVHLKYHISKILTD